MEPVPETRRLEEFTSSPASSLRLGPPKAVPCLDIDMGRKPPTVRRSTDPSPYFPTAPASSSSIQYRPRTASPLSAGAHLRSRSVACLMPPSATRTAPASLLCSPQLRPTSPGGSWSRVRAPRRLMDEPFPAFSSSSSSSPVRSSAAEAEVRPMKDERSSSPNPGPVLNPLNSPARLRRPNSPLRSLAHASASSLSLLPSAPTSSKSMEVLYGSYGSSLSSVPSTPTSARSRSPSISSLETIPDTPDAEEAALEAERVARLTAVADATDGSDMKLRIPADAPPRGRTMGFGSRDKRKRWSVCGAERRGDIDLETIWED